MTRKLFLASTALLASPLAAQEATPPVPTVPQPAPDATEPSEDEEGGDVDQEITVTGARPRGSVIGDIPPENVLDTRDIRATGATSIAELLSSVASQTGSARGRGNGPPVVLLNGQRISGFRELRDLPPEAILRMEILPEEVALKYGYSADQRVINFVLRRRFNSTTAEVGGRVATDGGYSTGRADVGKLIINENTRTSGNLRLEGTNPLYESERDITLRAETIDSRPFRTLVGAGKTARLSGTVSRPIGTNASGSLTGEFERRRGTSGLGLLGGDFLGRRNNSDTLGIGTALNRQAGRWRLSATGNVEVVESEADTELTGDLSQSTRQSVVVDGTANGPLVALPAGTANVTLRVGASALGIDSESRRAGVNSRANLNREVVEGSANVDLPLTERASAIGRLTANLNGGLRNLSDFGTLNSIGAGLNWSPKPRMNLLVSWTREEGAPSLQQLGDPLLDTTGVPFFDAVRGETVAVRTLTGGNPDLDADRRNVFKVGGNWQPLEDPDLRLRGEYVRQTIDNPQINFPAASLALQTAFPGRFQRDAEGQLISVDLRPVNAQSSKRETFRWGFDFTKSLRTQRPSPGTINRLVDRARQSGNIITQPAPGGGPAPVTGTASQRPAPGGGDNVIVVREGGPPPGAGAGSGGGGGGGFRFGGPGGGGGFGGGGRGGRITFSATHTLTLTDELVIGPGLPVLDYLDGEAVGLTGGRARHQVELESGYYNNGLGVRLSGNWRSATSVVTGGDDLRFSPYSTFDLRVFANLGERLDLVTRAPFFRGTSVRFEINNIFNSRPEVRGGAGTSNIPFAYQADRLEPIGRTVGVTFRKLFVPRRFVQQTVRRLRQGQQPE